MPGDTYTPPHHRDTTAIEDGHEISLHMGREDLIPQHLIQAQREALRAYGAERTVEREMTPLEKAAWELSELKHARDERVAAA